IEVNSSGLATAATAYLLTRMLLRTVTTRVLEFAPPAPGTTTGVGHQAVFIWLLTSAIPVSAVVAIGGFAPWARPSLVRLALHGVLIGGLVIASGFFATVLFAKSVGLPLCDLTQALEKIEAGDLSVRVPVNDPGEIGQLQAGFNRMVEAMREREQLRDLFGR